MKKLSLNVDTLRVQSFKVGETALDMPASPAAAALYGTSRCAYTDCTCPPYCVETV
ncbi:hypothetical protein [Longimicrobium terrae]|uniref:Uncharacterized protein n=1 Tax=Longimicrobium terrae TaxID=1639882 RepID=A0A841H547_9BACT|nr:hypothetical protein [Longimicrobium terrae]MBB4638921.1 hypothetical protein [Longimicrobium terrae]MBB6073160.1 hypothetical protein [Longimicrobium terrae]NNC30154.1 hypothetical protein [Longimicrobium terrae]